MMILVACLRVERLKQPLCGVQCREKCQPSVILFLRLVPHSRVIVVVIIVVLCLPWCVDVAVVEEVKKFSVQG